MWSDETLGLKRVKSNGTISFLTDLAFRGLGKYMKYPWYQVSVIVIINPRRKAWVEGYCNLLAILCLSVRVSVRPCIHWKSDGAVGVVLLSPCAYRSRFNETPNPLCKAL